MEQKTYLIKLNDGTIVTIKGALDLEEITNTLNSNVQFMNLGGIVVQKHMILSILPVEESNNA